MSGADLGSLFYLVLLGAVVASYFLAQNRQRMSRTLQQAAIWGLIFLGVIAAYGLWGDIRGTVSPRQMVLGETGQVMVPRAPDGSFYLTVLVNGAAIEFVVDTGATDIVLTRDDALRAGIRPEDLRFTGTARTANGEVPIAPVRLAEVRLGEISERNLRASVNGGELFSSLLGMSFLNRFQRLEITGDRLILTR